MTYPIANNKNDDDDYTPRVDLESVPSFFVQEPAPSAEPSMSPPMPSLWGAAPAYEFSQQSKNPTYTFARNTFPPFTLPPSSGAPTIETASYLIALVATVLIILFL